MTIHNGIRQPPVFSTPELWWNLAIVPLDNGNHNQQHCPALSMASYAGVLFMHGPGISPYGTVTVEVGYTPIGRAVWGFPEALSATLEQFLPQLRNQSGGVKPSQGHAIPLFIWWESPATVTCHGSLTTLWRWPGAPNIWPPVGLCTIVRANRLHPSNLTWQLVSSSETEFHYSVLRMPTVLAILTGR